MSANLVELNWNPDRRTLRQFGFIALVGFGLLAALAWFERGVFAFGLGEVRPLVAAAFAALALLSLSFSLLFPRGNWPIYVGLSVVALPIGFVLSYVILGTVFYAIIAPIGLILRLLGKDPMNRAFEHNASSYWVDARPPRPRESYFRQF
jgi:Saxitoxin biosynthesis operon protein SxtJ